MEATNILLGVVGKTNVGKSTFFTAATEVPVDIENRPFVTIQANVGVGYVRKRCVHVSLGLEGCDASNSICLGGWRMIPVKMMDVAGLVPGAHRGRGLGNRFLDDLRRADVLLLVVDASGSTDPEGVPVKPGSYDPVEEVRSMLRELDEWMYSIVRRDWDKFARTVDTSGVLDVPGAIAQRLSGLSIRKSHVVDALNVTGLGDRKLSSWSDDDLRQFIVELRRRAKPIVIVANKADIPGSEGNIERLRREFPDMKVIPTSALAEVLLRKASRAGAIRYIPGDSGFEVVDESKLNPKLLKALEQVRRLVLDRWGSTGVQDAINTAVLDVLGMIAVYPVDDPNRYSDKNGRVLPDVLLVPRGTTARELAYRIHTDLGKTFLYALNARTKQRLGEAYELQDDDVIKIVAAKG
ncbi:MAG: redox-regulated ATPase YchF [Desulfurococcales archaeon]|nr:redox-regulated ATPase YchF [Desulfurococcales archaeon]